MSFKDLKAGTLHKWPANDTDDYYWNILQIMRTMQTSHDQQKLTQSQLAYSKLSLFGQAFKKFVAYIDWGQQ